MERYVDLKCILFLEFENVSQEIESLNAVLDHMENKVINIKDQLLEILISNREILKELKEENQKQSQDGNNEPEKDGSEPMESS